MMTLTEALLDAWEQAAPQPPARRALTLLAAGEPDGQPQDWSVGARNRRLLQLRARLFGSRLSSVVDCPLCGSQLEFDLLVGDLLLPGPDPDPGTVHDAWDGDLRVSFRLPDSVQLAGVAGIGGVPGATHRLRETCLLQAERTGEPLELSRTPEAIWALLDREMAALDPLARLELDLSCPDCAHHWTAPLDPGEYLWAEVCAWSEGLLRDVHELALAYGWSQPDILALSPGRRERYLNLLRG